MSEPRPPHNPEAEHAPRHQIFINSNVERLKALGKKFGGAEGEAQRREADEAENQIAQIPDENIIQSSEPAPQVMDKIEVKPATDEEVEASKLNQTSDATDAGN